jgi:hypothetical protein
MIVGRSDLANNDATRMIRSLRRRFSQSKVVVILGHTMGFSARITNFKNGTDAPHPAERRRACRPSYANHACLLWVCAVQRRRFPVGANPSRQPLQPEATGAVMEERKWLKPSVSVSRIGDSASVQAVTRVNAEQASKRTMRRPTRQPFRGRLIRLGETERRVRPAAAPG